MFAFAEFQTFGPGICGVCGGWAVAIPAMRGNAIPAAGVCGGWAVAIPAMRGNAIVPAIVPAAPIPAPASPACPPEPRGKFDLRLAAPTVLDSKPSCRS